MIRLGKKKTESGIALLLVLAWLWQDTRANARNPYPWVVLTLAAGSIGPLLYLLTSPRETGKSAAPASETMP